jgi:hypothetical protein
MIFALVSSAQPAAKAQKAVRPSTRMDAATAQKRRSQGIMRMFLATSKIIATTDHGVVVMIGNKLFKYDRGLRLIKEAEVKVDAKDLEKMMMLGK